MSWSGFKKNVGRATTTVMMKTGQVQKTTDREYEVEERRYRTLESASLRLQKEAKGYLDSLRAMTASQMRIAETIDAFYGDSGATDGVSRSYKQAVEDLDAETVKALDGPYRCVPESLYPFADVLCGHRSDEVIREVEREWNFKAGNSRNYTRGVIGGRDCAGFERACELMDYVYRTTVLEPINRFCAYFPDINECIKKRHHKMLDYDALRSKVKKLTEKPDKDPGKLPRTEKEMEMVSLQHFLDTAPQPPADDPDEDGVDLSIPSPSKALQRPEIQKLRRMAGYERPRSWVIGRTASTNRRSLSLKFFGAAADDANGLARSSSAMAGPDTFSSNAHGAPDVSPTRNPRFRNLPFQPHSTVPSLTRSGVPMASTEECTESSRQRPTPFFQPSELEEIMQPLKADFIQRQANEFAQARATYEQLNDQLTSELPQLIDLRVPYLDPSFEALVKIQLRFCAEAYSRMAQVQQYLDASTRDQYASGDLDARVEDVLGQIRELSIAGTV